MPDGAGERRAERRQMAGSLLVALLIAGVAIVAVTVRIGPTSAAEQERLERVERERTERLEERLERREERLEQRREARERR